MGYGQQWSVVWFIAFRCDPADGPIGAGSVPGSDRL